MHLPSNGKVLPHRSVPNAKEFYPLNVPDIGTPLPAVFTLQPAICGEVVKLNSALSSVQEKFPQNHTIPKLFQPLKIRDTTFKNRIWVVGTFVFT
ncbi:hypothetical protein BOTBODRAFT_203681 [Botryobasidium botryosum FD-172 SS1]|uniref:Uncharacterized protein n=1 Tax=Botryobasidium botryosum (strain FD-172 SS1) TaxID=930990 RepID=A0A067NBF6_BOTB1|nr:hypothetical protein BOTBODRAFT_203681 [Botryobasidium botryosum FD-172 SS1]